MSPELKCMWCRMLLCLYLAICLRRGPSHEYLRCTSYWGPSFKYQLAHAISQPHKPNTVPLSKMCCGVKIPQSKKRIHLHLPQVGVPNQVDLYRKPHDELNGTIDISPRYLQSPHKAPVTCLVEWEQMVAAPNHHWLYQHIPSHALPHLKPTWPECQFVNGEFTFSSSKSSLT